MYLLEDAGMDVLHTGKQGMNDMAETVTVN